MKFFFKSRTFWTALVIAFMSAFSPSLQDWIAKNPGVAGNTVSFIIIFLRIITTGPVTIGKQTKKN